ncbi:DNA topoisomerase VI subunit B [Candidatus Woesearchaeota archaeon]|nr:DNA topoisomerase VI subunit B [Candidatus Woesearchaeota archaeon]MBT6735421.1 DNA topoisomerase VI subunit B [Candidatus Woesearchaeota archaeon]MBT7169458.1 DNA topoisomerase VI subunit B [Candidatus Woesearchaeota archaeon]MBT7474771.1 DNA topoisomerase VI subunit B [Candidatus Woesearchaeota archaeon]
MQTTLSENKKEISHAIEQAKKQRDISISEFFTKNRHLLGFDNPLKAISTTIKEGVDNALDAAEDANILPDVIVEVKQTTPERYLVTIEDNGPGIVKEQIPNIFGRLLYGSKFHKLSQTRGQQGIGISAAGLYGQLTTGKPVKIISKIGKNDPAHHYELHLDTTKNESEIAKKEIIEWDKDHGTKISIEMEGKYQRGKRSVSEYMKYTAVSNPHARLTLIEPDGTRIDYPRGTTDLPIKPKEIKPHPDGIELGILINMLKATKAKTLQSFLTTEFSRIGAGTAKKICELAKLYTNSRPSRIAKDEADNLLKAIRGTKFIAPPTNCLSPIGNELLTKSLKKEFDADFYASVTRPAAVYRGNPFVVEAGIAYGGKLPGDSASEIIRFANRVPLQYQQSACSSIKSITDIKWRQYGLQQSGKNIPVGPVVIVVHIASVWVPFTSESKESIAHYPEIIKEIKLAVQECGRQLGKHVRKQKKVKDEAKKRSYLEKYVPIIGDALKELLDLQDPDVMLINENLKDQLERSRKI